VYFLGCSIDKNLLVKFGTFKGPLGDFLGNCVKLEGLKVDKSRLGRPRVASVDGSINY
jgi:hypothetical protein